MSNTILFELGTEELPPTSLLALSNSLNNSVEASLKDAKVNYENFKGYCSPRRLAFTIDGLDEKTPLEKVTVWGPPAKIAFDAESKPSKAAEAFCKRNNVAIEQIETASDGKVDKIFCSLEQGGESSIALLPEFIEKALAQLPIAKRMRWGSSRTEFVRPTQWLVFLNNDTIIDCEILGQKAGRVSRGHRFLSEGDITLAHANEYQDSLKTKGKVVVSFSDRQALICKQVQEQAKLLNATAVIDDDLLDEVTGLVEWPVALSGRFSEDFLSVPSEALISSMKEHQKYFHLVDKDNQLVPHFITISNIEADDYSAIISGNEKVIRPRLADAAFFFSTDKKTTLEARREQLKTVVFQAKLGSIFDKTERIRSLSLYISGKLPNISPNFVEVDENNLARAAELCKSDLVSNMVSEFPEMQGIAGFHYAISDGENSEVASAIVEHYQPKSSGDTLPESHIGAIIALADRIDTITGIFAIGQKPTGSKDPFALRRSSLGALRILVKNDYALDLRDLVRASAKPFSHLPNADTVEDDVLTYILDRFKAWYVDAGIPITVYQAVQAINLTKPFHIDQNVKAVYTFLKEKPDDAMALAEANKRIANILNKLDTQPEGRADPELLTEDAEIELEKRYRDLVIDKASIFSDGQIGEDSELILEHLSKLRNPVDDFFKDVMVMVDDEEIKMNRLRLLKDIRDLFLIVADISYLVPAK